MRSLALLVLVAPALVIGACQTLPVVALPDDESDAADAAIGTDAPQTNDAASVTDATSPIDAASVMDAKADATNTRDASDASDAMTPPPVCTPGDPLPCYEGAAGTEGVGACVGGMKTCNAAGTGYGACVGQVLPAAAETCDNAIDDTCNGTVDEGCEATYTKDVQPIFAAKCSPCHTVGGSGGANFAISYADTQLPSYYCVGETKGACTLVRILDGSMPPRRGCTGNAALDVGNTACMTAAEQATIKKWILDGQLP
jgi:hypothetical protein